MLKGKSKSAAAHSVKAAIGTAALLASGASAKGLRESGAGYKEEVVVASFQISSKQGLNDELHPSESNLKVVEKVVAETAPFSMNHLRKRSLEVVTVTDPPIDEANDGEKAKKKKEKKKKKKKM